ncbi:MAG: hypothetical protein H0U87_07360 [Acidobacteria bacterium]|jgi:hypothetical protein|nr:hypothetical protein [Acidobacteriota bacterium]
MKNQRLKQFACGFFVVLSLLASTVSAACICSTHAIKTNEDAHCRRHEEQYTARPHSHQSAAENTSVSFSETDECCCVQSAPRAFAKSESLKIEKQSAASLSFSLIKFACGVSQNVSVKTVDFTTPFYLSDSFHNLTPGRVPPRL